MVYNGCKDGIFYKKVHLSTANCILNHANLKHLCKKQLNRRAQILCDNSTRTQVNSLNFFKMKNCVLKKIPTSINFENAQIVKKKSTK